MAVIDLSQLPAPQIVDVPDFETLLAERKAEFVALHPKDEQEAVIRTLELESEPVTKLLQENAYRELLLRQRINELQYQRSWRHAANSRVNRRPSTQFLGPDNDMLTLSGVLMPEITGGRLSLLALEQMAEQGKAWPLIEGSGTIYGMYVIEGLNQTKTEFFRDGMPRRIEFTLSLKRVDESLSDMFGDLSAQLNNLQGTATSALSDISKTVGGLLS